ncbi:hypothetical protein Tco_0798029 [Tanacetum coccineum]
MNFILDQKEKVKQLEEYMGVIGRDFMQLSLEVVEKLKEEIRMEKSRVKKIKKITRYPDTEDLEPLNEYPQSTPQVLPSFEEYTPPVTYPKEVEETLRTLIEVEPLNEIKLKEVGLNCSHNTPFSSREVPSFDGPEPQPLLNSPSLDKPEESNGFEEIIDFLNESFVQYALTVNPTICTTYIEQFWTSAKLDDAEGTDCPATATIFAELERMGVKTTSWNEFSSTMAYAIICLATNQKFNLSKYIFDNMVKNLDGGVKFLMYPRFVQVFLDKQVENMSKHKGVYVTPFHTKKVFVNIKRPCKGFSGRVSPLFSTMMVQATEDIGADLATPTDSHSTPIITQSSSSKSQKKKSRRKQRKDSAPTEPTTKETTPEEHVSTPSYDPPLSGEDRMQLAELMSLCTNLQEKVLNLEKAKTAQAKEITSLKKSVKQLEKRRKSRILGLRRLRKVGSSSRVESSNDASLDAQEDASK